MGLLVRDMTPHIFHTLAQGKQCRSICVGHVIDVENIFYMDISIKWIALAVWYENSTYTHV